MRIVSTAFVHELIYVFNSFYLFFFQLFCCMEYYNLLTLSCAHTYTNPNINSHHFCMTTNAQSHYTLHTLHSAHIRIVCCCYSCCGACVYVSTTQHKYFNGGFGIYILLLCCRYFSMPVSRVSRFL